LEHRGTLIVALLAAALLGGVLLPVRVPASSATISFTKDQAAAGQTIFETTCSPCHGSQLEGGAGPALHGPAFNTLANKVHATVGDIFTYMSTNMPLNNPASLKHGQYVDIMAFILSKNGWHAGNTELTFEAASSSKADPVHQ
jgi:polar amino acid transport system substrate-binding protein